MFVNVVRIIVGFHPVFLCHSHGLAGFVPRLFHGGDENGLDLIPGNESSKDVLEVRIVWIRSTVLIRVVRHEIKAVFLGFKTRHFIGELTHGLDPFCAVSLGAKNASIFTWKLGFVGGRFLVGAVRVVVLGLVATPSSSSATMASTTIISTTTTTATTTVASSVSATFVGSIATVVPIVITAAIVVVVIASSAPVIVV